MKNKKSLIDNGYKFVHIEGMDLSGKSTLVKNFVADSKQKWCIRNKILTDNNPIWNFANDLRKKGIYDEEVFNNLYFAAALADVSSYERKDENVIQDSIIALRSLSYAKYLNNHRTADAFLELLKKHPKPTHSIYLYADIPTRNERLKKRISERPNEVTAGDRTITSNIQKFEEIEKLLRKFSIENFTSHVINTSKLSEYEVLNNAKEIIGGNL